MVSKEFANKTPQSSPTRPVFSRRHRICQSFTAYTTKWFGCNQLIHIKNNYKRWKYVDQFWLRWERFFFYFM